MNKSYSVSGDAPQRLDGLTPQQLVSEILEISAQYEKEVPGGRRRWPESIRSRVLALGRLGVTPSQTSELTKISRATVYLWCRKLPTRRARGSARPNAEFVQLPVSPTVRRLNESITVGQQIPFQSPASRLPAQTATHGHSPVTLTTPDGYRFEFSGCGAWPMASAAYTELKAVRP